MTDETRSVVVERVMPHPPAKIWRALTEGATVKEWLMDNDLEPVVGRKFRFRATPVRNWDGVIECEVLVVEPVTKLSYSWGTLGVETVVVWTLIATNAGTIVRMEQSGFGPDQNANYNGARYGWTKFIGGLERLLATTQ